MMMFIQEAENRDHPFITIIAGDYLFKKLNLLNFFF